MQPYTLIRSRRKTVAIHITKDIVVEVRALLKMSKSDIDKFVNLKKEWIETHLAAREQLNEVKTAYTLEYGDTVLLQGKPYPIRTKNGNRAGFNLECFNIPPDLTPDGIKQAVIQIYKLMAKRIIKEKVENYSKIMGVTPTAIRITSAKTRWGSCSGKNSINFSWRLVIADDDVIEYVVVHELSHIKEHNPSNRFWKEVENVLPDYKDRQKKLKIFQKKLLEQNWD